MRKSTSRARPLSVEDRQASIIEAVIPLLAEHGRAVTSRQIAERAGVAEGTIFRAFGDKESLIEAAIDSFLAPDKLRAELRRVDASLPLEEKIRTFVVLLQSRFTGIIRMMTVLQGPGRPPRSDDSEEYARIIAEALAPDLERLAIPGERIARYLRIVAFASAFPQPDDREPFTAEELTTIIIHGITGASSPVSE